MSRARKAPRTLRALSENLKRATVEALWWGAGYSAFGGSDLFDRIRNNLNQDVASGMWAPPNVPSDRRGGANWPLWRTEIELDIFRQQSRMCVSAANSFGKGLLKNLTNAVIGKGYSYKMAAKKDPKVKPDSPGMAPEMMDGLIKGAQDVVDEFLAANRWNATADPREMVNPNGTREREGFRRTRRDGEALVRFFFMEEGELRGKTRVRFMEPEQLRNPPGATLQDGWSFGMRHKVDPFPDTEDIQEYHFVFQSPEMATPGESMAGELVPASEIVHIKNVDEDAATKRGMPDFVLDVMDALNRARTLQRNISISSAIRAATAEFWEHETATKDSISSMAQGLAEYQQTNPVSQQTENVERIAPGTIRRTPKGQKLVFPAASNGTTEQLAAAQGDLRQASTAFTAPEYMTGNAENNNYASSKEAGTPFVRTSECDQEHFKGAFAVCVWKAIRWAVECGLLPPEALTLLDLQVEAPDVTSRDTLEQAQEDQILTQGKIKSPQTAQMERGLDPETEMTNFAEVAEMMGPALPGLPMPDDGQPVPPSNGRPAPGANGNGKLNGAPKKPAVPGGNRLREGKDATGHEHAADGKFGKGGKKADSHKIDVPYLMANTGHKAPSSDPLGLTTHKFPEGMDKTALKSAHDLSTNPFMRPTVPAIAHAVKQQHAGATDRDVHAALVKLHRSGHVELGPYTQALATIPAEQLGHVIPLDRDPKFYVKPMKRLNESREKPGRAKHGRKSKTVR